MRVPTWNGPAALKGAWLVSKPAECAVLFVREYALLKITKIVSKPKTIDTFLLVDMLYPYFQILFLEAMKMVDIWSLKM